MNNWGKRAGHQLDDCGSFETLGEQSHCPGVSALPYAQLKSPWAQKYRPPGVQVVSDIRVWLLKTPVVDASQGSGDFFPLSRPLFWQPQGWETGEMGLAMSRLPGCSELAPRELDGLFQFPRWCCLPGPKHMPEPGTESLCHGGWDSQEPIFPHYRLPL